MGKRKNIPEGTWNRCDVCKEIIFSKNLERNLKICPKCDYHFPMFARERIDTIIEPGDFSEYDRTLVVSNPKDFPEGLKAKDAKDSFLAGEGKIDKHHVVLFACARMWSVTSVNHPDNNVIASEAKQSDTEYNLRFIDYATLLYAFSCALQQHLPVITFYADGTMLTSFTDDLGLRTVPIPFVQITNLAATIEALSQEHIPHITVLTNPRIHGDFQTSLPIGDIVLAEPKCGDIGTHNPAMGKPGNTRQHQLQHPVEDNLIDMYVNRKDLKKTLIQILSFFAG
ncbi:MAG: hypothetical protein H8D67_14885 [Deltaproteobacteria bacterium]|nr:hypothetical protein [Deltaproteobacteria bacterium]